MEKTGKQVPGYATTFRDTSCWLPFAKSKICFPLCVHTCVSIFVVYVALLVFLFYPFIYFSLYGQFFLLFIYLFFCMDNINFILFPNHRYFTLAFAWSCVNCSVYVTNETWHKHDTGDIWYNKHKVYEAGCCLCSKRNGTQWHMWYTV